MSSSKSPSGGKSPGGQAGSSGGKRFYPLWFDQVCDYCGSKEHEAQKCKVEVAGFAGIHCKSCGHGDHRAKDCPLVPFSKKGPKPVITPEMYDQFTPLFREKYASKTPATPTTGGAASPRSAKLPSRTQKSANSPSTSGATSSKMEQPEESENEDPKAAQIKRWELAEKQVPSKRSPESTHKDAIPIKANFFEIKLDDSVNLLKYSITIEQQRPVGTGTSNTPPDRNDTRKIKRETKRFLIENYLQRNVPSHSDWATDWNSTIISRGPIFSTAKLGIILPAPSNQSTGNNTNSHRPPRPPLMTSVSLVGKVDLAGLKKHVEGKGLKSMQNPGEVLDALNIISWKEITKPGSQIVRVGNKFYPQSQWNKGQESSRLPKKEKYFLRHGFFTSMRPGQDSVLLNVNPVTTAFISPINLQKWIETAWNLFPDPRTGYRPLPPISAAFKLKLKTIRVTLDLHPNNSRLWVICGISDKKMDTLEFQKDDGSRERVATYLRRKYNQAYRPDAAGLQSYCINVGSDKKEIWYPADRLTIVDWQVARESVEEASGQKMVDKATRRPQANKDLIMGEGLKVLGLTALQPFHKKFGMTPTPTMVELKAPILNPPKLRMGPKDPPKVVNGEWRISNQTKFYEQAKSCEKLCIIRFDKPVTAQEMKEKRMDENKLRQHNKQLALTGIEALKTALGAYGIFPKLPTVVRDEPTMPARNPKSQFRANCTTMLNTAAAKFGSKSVVKFILIILEERDIQFYGEVKRWGDCDFGVPTVCVTAAKLEKVADDPKLLANICLKINFKLKGVGHSLDPTTPKGTITGAANGTMIVGADVTHPGKGLDNCPSMAGVVATDDEVSSRYLGSARLQKGRQEYIEDLEGMVFERLKAWVEKVKETNKSKTGPNKVTGKNMLPKNILFYRDGVSESQYGMVLHEEKPQILRACRKVLTYYTTGTQAPIPSVTKWTPKLTLVVVTKRHHSRFYPLRDLPPGHANSPEDVNTPCGMVVDSKVVTPNHWSFYLQSHTSGLGTARAAHYVVVYDDADYTAKKLQEITNNICYTSARATKAVSVCTPARYADLLCDRLRCYMRPVLDGSYTVPTRPPPSSPNTTGSSKAAVSTPAEDEDDDDDESLSYIRRTRADPNVWKKPTSDPDLAKRKNPWAANLDGCMFYL